MQQHELPGAMKYSWGHYLTCLECAADRYWCGSLCTALQETAKNTVALRSFNDALLQDNRVSISIIPVGDGMALCRRRQ